jgi:hypothetical protein
VIDETHVTQGASSRITEWRADVPHMASERQSQWPATNDWGGSRAEK